jgi:hypothetical protein
MSQDFPLSLPAMLIWLVILPLMYFGFAAANRVLRRKLPWLFSPRAWLIQMFLGVAGVSLMVIFFPPRFDTLAKRAQLNP